MTRRASILILVGIVAAIGVVFYRVIQPFLFSLLFAAVVGVLFRPVFSWIEIKLNGRRRLAAALTTLGISLVFMIPVLTASVIAGFQLFQVAGDVISWANPETEAGLSDQLKEFQDSKLYAWGNERWTELDDDQKSQLKGSASKLAGQLAEIAYSKTQEFIGNVISFVLGLLIMIVAIYYFYADGPELMLKARRFSPLSDKDEQALITRFEKVCRGVVFGTVASAFVQAFLAWIGFVVVGVDHALLLGACTMFFAFIPFLGAGVVWVSVCVVLLVEQHFIGAGVLFVYGVAIVSTSDNVIKAHVIGGEAKLHPLIVLITVLGALKLIGILGIFIGPMVAAFLYAFLDILRSRMLFGGQLGFGLASDDGANGTDDSGETAGEDSAVKEVKPGKPTQLDVAIDRSSNDESESDSPSPEESQPDNESGPSK